LLNEERQIAKKGMPNMNETPSKRRELGGFLRDGGTFLRGWRILHISAVPELGCIFDVFMFLYPVIGTWRIYAFHTADYAIRPPNPASMVGGPLITLSADDPRVFDARLQEINDDGKVYDPPRRFQVLDLDQSWIIAERFEIEQLQQSRVQA
jgi:hypothetical protein